MTFRTVVLGTNFEKVLVYDAARVSLAINNLSSVATIDITDSPDVNTLNFWTLEAKDVLTLYKSWGDEPERALYARASLAGTQVQIYEGYRS